MTFALVCRYIKHYVLSDGRRSSSGRDAGDSRTGRQATRNRQGVSIYYRIGPKFVCVGEAGSEPDGGAAGRG